MGRENNEVPLSKPPLWRTFTLHLQIEGSGRLRLLARPCTLFSFYTQQPENRVSSTCAPTRCQLHQSGTRAPKPKCPRHPNLGHNRKCSHPAVESYLKIATPVSHTTDRWRYAFKHAPSCHPASTVVPVSNQRGKPEWQQEDHEPEECTVCSEAWANMWRASVKSCATLAGRVWDLPVRRTFVPIVVIVLAGIVVWQ